MTVAHDPVPSPEELAREIAAPQDRPRWRPSTIGGVFFLIILATTVAGIGLVVAGNWRLGVRIFAGALLAASLLRLVLPVKDAGMLAVRHRIVDCVILAGSGGTLMFLAQTIPGRPL